MCNFNQHNEETKALMHSIMSKAAEAIGGANFLLSLIEAMKTKKPNPLMFNECQISSNNTIIKWNKVIFKDKVDVLEKILMLHKSSKNQNFNLLETPNSKNKKAITNMIRTLSPITFTVTPQNPNDGEGFSFSAFEMLKEDNVQLNPLFVSMFFCSVEYTKKSLKYTKGDE